MVPTFTSNIPYPILIHVQNLTLNVQQSIYPSTIPKWPCNKPFVPPISIPIIANLIEQNLVGFPNSMFPFVGPYPPFFGFGYNGMGSVPTMWPLMFGPFANIIAAPKLVSGVA